jgi:hypothetical protein
MKVASSYSRPAARLLAALAVVVLSPAALAGDELDSARALLEAWEAEYRADAGDGAPPFNRKECSETGFSVSCSYDIGIEKVSVKVTVPVEADEISFRSAKLLLGGATVGDTGEVIADRFGAFLPASLAVLGWSEADPKRAEDMTSSIMEEGLARLPDVGPENDNVTVDLTYASISGSLRNIAASYAMKVLADGPHLYDDQLAEKRTKTHLRRNAEELERTARDMQRKLGEQ